VTKGAKLEVENVTFKIFSKLKKSSSVNRSLQSTINQVGMRVSKIDQMNLSVSKIDQLLFLYIAVDRFFKRTLLLHLLLKYVLRLIISSILLSMFITLSK